MFPSSHTLKQYKRDTIASPENKKPAFSNSSGFKSVSEKLRDALVWTVGLTVEIKLRFQISLA